MRVCIIHAGTHKTGTTSIQNALELHTEELLRAGWKYPVSGRQGGHHSIAFSLFDPTRCDMYGGNSIKELFLELGGTSQNVILSSEEFIHAIHYGHDSFQTFIERLRSLFDEIKIYVYLRSQTDYIISNYLERVKWGLSCDFTFYLEARIAGNFDEFPLDYNILINEVSSVEHASVVIRDYNVIDAVGDFFSVCGIPYNRQTAPPRQNVQVDLSTSFLAYYKNCVQRSPGAKEIRCIEAFCRETAQGTATMSNAYKLLIQRSFDSGNRQVSQRFGLSGLDYNSDVSQSRIANRDFALEPLLEAMPLTDGKECFIDRIFLRNIVAALNLSN